MGRTYRSMQGKEVDLQALKAKFELTPAVSNVRMNARGDILDTTGKIIKTKEQLASEGMVGNSQAAAAPQRTPAEPEVYDQDGFEPSLTEQEALEILNKKKKK
jgi:hypothetical protein